MWPKHVSIPGDTKPSSTSSPRPHMRRLWCSHRGQSWAQQFCTWYALASGFRLLSLSHSCVYMHPRGRRIAACYIDHNCTSGSKPTGFDWLMEMGRNRLGRRTINRGESFEREMSCKNGWMQELFASFLYRVQVLYISQYIASTLLIT